MSIHKLSEMKKLAIELIDYLAQKELWSGTIIYVGSRAYHSYDTAKNSFTEKTTKSGHKYYIEENVTVTDRLEYCNPKTITLTFEGPLYDTINYYDYDFVDKLQEKFLTKHNMYFEQGYAWSLSAYDN